MLQNGDFIEEEGENGTGGKQILEVQIVKFAFHGAFQLGLHVVQNSCLAADEENLQEKQSIRTLKITT